MTIGEFTVWMVASIIWTSGLAVLALGMAINASTF